MFDTQEVIIPLKYSMSSLSDDSSNQTAYEAHQVLINQCAPTSLAQIKMCSIVK